MSTRQPIIREPRRVLSNCRGFSNQLRLIEHGEYHEGANAVEITVETSDQAIRLDV